MNTVHAQDSLKKVLVFGDWFVDDYWVIGPHRSSTASRTGHALYRVLQSLDKDVESFCGAGRPASILCRARTPAGINGGQPVFEVHGVGIWYPGDTEDLRAMLDPCSNDRYNLHTLVRAKASTPVPSTGKLHCLPVDLEEGRKPGTTAGTTRIIRLYQRFGDKAEVLERIDWVLETPVDDRHERAWFSRFDTIEKLQSWVKDKDEKLPEEVDAVLIKDMRYGAVSQITMRWLAQRYPEAEWFISSKSWKPSWFDEISDMRVRLFLIPQAAAQTPVTQEEISRWITEREPSREALKLLEELAKRFSVEQHRLIVVLPCDESILALSAPKKAEKNKKDKDSWQLMVQYRDRPRDHKVPLPMASVFFPALASQLIGRDAKSTDAFDAVKTALAFTLDWRDRESGRLVSHEEWSPEHEPRIYVPDKREKAGEWRGPFPWNYTSAQWETAFQLPPFTRTSQGLRSLQLWRAMTELDGYVCCVDEKRKVIRKLRREVTRFVDARGERPVSAMLIASPGDGKTHLVRMLANTCKLQFVSCNLTQMVSRGNLIEFFDRIVTLQAQDRNQLVLAFVDEINAQLQGQPVYDAFLTPLEEGVYVRNSQVMHISPCAWVFAGTEDPTKTDAVKGSDFLSRLTLQPVCKLQIGKDMNEARVEKVYLGVALLKEMFPDVRFISDKVVYLLMNEMFDKIGVRQLKHFIKSFENIQYTKVLWRNVPRKWLSTVLLENYNEDTWKNKPEDENDLFEIEVTPSF